VESTVSPVRDAALECRTGNTVEAHVQTKPTDATTLGPSNVLRALTPPVLETLVPHDDAAATLARETKAARVLVRIACLALLLGAAACTGGTFVHVPDFPDTLVLHLRR